MMKKIPEITAIFWIMKICATTLGETAGDLFSMTFGMGYGWSSAMLFCIFLALLFLQLLQHRYQPAIYWAVILATSTAGTTISDLMDRTAGLGYMTGSIILMMCLILTLLTWKRASGSLDVASVNSTKAEVFYWVAILFSNTLGTALGDFLADDTGLGFSGGALIISILLLAIALSYYLLKVSPVFLFWAAFVLTRPFGATFGDILTKPQSHGGLDLGTIGSSMVLLSILAALVLFQIIQGTKNEG